MRGVAIVEFAIAVPVLLLLITATVELGRAFIQYTVLANGVRDASRHLAGRALLGTTGIVSITGQLQADVANLVVYGNTAGTGAPVLPSLAPGQVSVTSTAANDVTVSVVYPYQALLGSRLPAFGASAEPSMVFNMQVAVTMRAL